jgi:hypothetical protein
LNFVGVEPTAPAFLLANRATAIETYQSVGREMEATADPINRGVASAMPSKSRTRTRYNRGGEGASIKVLVSCNVQLRSEVKSHHYVAASVLRMRSFPNHRESQRAVERDRRSQLGVRP